VAATRRVSITEAFRVLLLAGLVLTIATCQDGTAPQTTFAPVVVAPIFPSDAALASFGLAIDGVRFVVVRPSTPPDTLADTTVAIPPDAESIDLDLRVPLISSAETLHVSIVAMSGAIPLFEGTAPVEVRSGVRPSTPTEIPVLSYVGPGAGVDSIVVLPRLPFMFFNDSLRFQVEAFQAGVPVSQVYVSWTTSDTSVARVNSNGVLRAPAARTSVRVIARTPGGAAADSTTATFQPLPAQLIPVGGAGQSGTVGFPLQMPLEVEVRAADNLPVGGVAVRFRALSGIGSVTDSVYVTDATGRARTTATLGNVIGTQNFEARVTGLAGSPAIFGVTALAGAAAQLLVVAGDGQLATVNTLVSTAPAVQAQDQFGNPVPGAAITFGVSIGGGRVSGPTQLTTASGIATVGGWALGTASGANALTATLAGLTPVTFTATGIAGGATQIVQLAGDGQAATVNTILATAPAVIVRDQFDNAVPGVPVLFAPASGGGSVTDGSAVTDTAGVARVGSWQLGTPVGQNTLTASASGLAGSPVLFTANASRDVAFQLLRASIDTQTATAGQPVSTPPAVQVADQYGNPVPGASVTFTLTGALIGSLAPSSATTDSMGVARVTSWSLAAIAGLNTLDAAVPGLVGSPMTFSANGTTTTATNMLLNAGDGQLGVVGTALPTVYSVAVRNALALPVQNVQVHWAAGPAGGSMNPATSLTDASGIASSTHTLGSAAGTQTATASVGGLAGSPITFTATAQPGAAAQIVKQSIDPQTGTVATAVTAPVIKVADQFGNGVAGAIVDFAPSGGGTLGAVKDTSDGAGLATSSSWTLGTLAGLNTLSASAAGVQAVTFSATGVAGAVSQLVFITPPSHTLADDSISPAPQVAFQDTFGNTVPEATGVVVLGIGAVPDFFAKLTGTLGAAAAGGVATFRHAQIDSAGQGYTLRASDGNVVGESPQFDIGGVIAAIPVARGPVAAALDPRTKKIYVPGASSVSVLLDDRELLPQIPGFESPFGVAANAITNQIYVSSLLGLVVIDGTRTPDVVRLSIPVGTGAKGVAVDEQTNFIYVAATDPLKGGPALVPVDGSKDLVVPGDVVALPAPGVGVAFNRNDGLVYVAIPTLQEVVVIDPKPGGARVVAEIRNLGKLTHGVAVDVRTNLLYVTNQGDNNVSVINLVDFKEIARLQVGLNPEGLGVDSDRGVVYVANSGANTVSLIDGVKLNVFATLVVGPAPKAPVVDPVTGRVYVPTQQDDRVRVIQP
jgi:adhesin/invasin